MSVLGRTSAWGCQTDAKPASHHSRVVAKGRVILGWTSALGVGPPYAVGEDLRPVDGYCLAHRRKAPAERLVGPARGLTDRR